MVPTPPTFRGRRATTRRSQSSIRFTLNKEIDRDCFYYYILTDKCNFHKNDSTIKFHPSSQKKCTPSTANTPTTKIKEIPTSAQCLPSKQEPNSMLPSKTGISQAYQSIPTTGLLDLPPIKMRSLYKSNKGSLLGKATNKISMVKILFLIASTLKTKSSTNPLIAKPEPDPTSKAETV